MVLVGRNTPDWDKKALNVDYRVTIAFYDDLMWCCARCFKHTPMFFGGDEIVCQIDESIYHHIPKYNRWWATEHELLVLVADPFLFHGRCAYK